MAHSSTIKASKSFYTQFSLHCGFLVCKKADPNFFFQEEYVKTDLNYIHQVINPMASRDKKLCTKTRVTVSRFFSYHSNL